jgi:transcriptional regulator with XRE-family HTH domain
MTSSDITADVAPVRRERGRQRATKRAPRPVQIEPIDLHIGARIRGARGLRNRSRAQLGRQVGLGEQAIEKYELGLSRVLASRLFDLAKALGLPVQWFYEDFDPHGPQQDTEDLEALRRAMTSENMQLLHALQRLTHAQQRAVMQTIEGLIMSNRTGAGQE